MVADTSVVTKKREWNSMAGEEEWMEKHRDMEGKRKRLWTPTRAKAQDTRTSANNLEIHLVRKWRGVDTYGRWAHGVDGWMNIIWIKEDRKENIILPKALLMDWRESTTLPLVALWQSQFYRPGKRRRTTLAIFVYGPLPLNINN